MSDDRNGYSRSRSRSPETRQRHYSRSNSPRRSYSPRSRSRSPRHDRRRSRSPRRDDRRDHPHHRSSGHSGQGRRVYVGNLAYDVKWGQLKDFMRSAGEVVHADVLMLPNGMSKGCGVVEYATSAEAQRAISELSNQTINGRMVYIREDREQEKGFGMPRTRGYTDRPERSDRHYSSSRDYGNDQITSPQLFIQNLPYSVSWQDLKDLFRNAGHVVRSDINTNYDGRSKGSGIVLFESISEAQNAIKQFQGYDWQGRILEIREDRFAGRGRGGGRGGSVRPYAADRGYSASESYTAEHSSRPPPVVEPNPFTDHTTGNGDPSTTIFVNNLPWSTTNEDLVDLFVTIGKVERAEICYEYNGRSKGCGVVSFDHQDTAAIAIQKFSGYLYGGRPLGLSYVLYETHEDVRPPVPEDQDMPNIEQEQTA